MGMLLQPELNTRLLLKRFVLSSKFILFFILFFVCLLILFIHAYSTRFKI